MTVVAWIAMPCSVMVLVFSAQLPLPGFEVLTMQLGALGALIWAIYYLLAVHIPRRDKEFQATLDKMAERHERWECVRHEDSESLRITLASMEKNWVAVQAHLMAERANEEGR